MRAAIVISVMCVIMQDCLGEGSGTSRPLLRIIEPQKTCEASMTEKLETKVESQITSVKLEPVGGAVACYQWQVKPRLLNPPGTQWLNLNAWRSARLIEKSIAGQRESILKTNEVSINNSQLVSGISYEFRVTAFPNSCTNGERGDIQNFTLAVTDKGVQLLNKANIPDAGAAKKSATLTLAGSDFTYPELQYMIEAQATFCQPIDDYSFKWTLTGPTGDVTPQSLRGKLLKLPSNYFQAGSVYNVQCEIQQVQNKTKVAQATMKINVMKRKWEIKLNFIEIVISLNRPVTIIATLYYASESDIVYSWKCRVVETDADCLNFNDENSNVMTTSFSEEGRHEVSVLAKSGASSAETSCIIIATQMNVPEINIESMRSSYEVIPAGAAVSITATTAGLKPGCELKWMTVKADKLAYFNESTMPVDIGSMSITSLDESSSLELSEFVNETVQRDIPLEIPAKSERWQGISGDSKYRMRLDARCKCMPGADHCEGAASGELVSYADVLLETNAAPEISDVMVTPAVGTAFSTIFSISTTPAKDKSEDYPLQYIYSLNIKWRQILIGSYLTNAIVKTVLPYSGNPIIVECKVCDARGACAAQISRPILIQLPKDFTEDDCDKFIVKYEATMTRQEYDDVIVMLYGSLEMFKAMDNPACYKKIVDSTYALLRKDIQILSENSFEEEFISTYIKKAKYILDILNQQPEDIVHGLLDLYNNHVLAKRRRKRAAASQNQNSLRIMNEDDINTGLDLMQQAIYQSQNQTVVRIQESKLSSNIERFLTGLCGRDSRYKFDKKITSFSLETINLSKRYNIFLPIPFYNETAEYLNKSSAAFVKFGKEFSDINDVCLGGVMFPRNYYVEKSEDSPNRVGLLYGIYLIDLNKNFIKSNGNKVYIRLPISNIPNTNDGELVCCKVLGKNCDETICATDSKITEKSIQYVQCSCRSLGYFSLKLKEKPATEKPAVTPSVVTQSTTNQPASTSTSSVAVTNVAITTEVATVTTVTEITKTPTTTMQMNNTNENTLSSYKATAGNKYTIPVISVLLVFCLSITAFFWYKRRKNRQSPDRSLVEAADNESIAESNLCLIDSSRCGAATLSYRDLYDEHLLDGSIQIIDQYNEGLIPYGIRSTDMNYRF